MATPHPEREVIPSIHGNVHGSIVLGNTPGRRLRKIRGDVLVRDILYLSGAFCAGDRAYLSFMGADGGLYVIATGLVAWDAAALGAIVGTPFADPYQRMRENADNGMVVVAESGITLLWPT